MFRLQKIRDMGTSHPFYARLMLGLLELRDHALRAKYPTNKIESVRLVFDKAFKAIVDAAETTLVSAGNIQELAINHKKKVVSGKIIRFQPNVFEIRESIDRQITAELKEFIRNSVTAIKDCQKITKQFGIDIAHQFQNVKQYEKGVSNLITLGHKELVKYLHSVRTKWSEKLVEKRDAIEHRGLVLPGFEYKRIDNKRVEAMEPKIDGLKISDYSEITKNRTVSFVENVIAYTLKTALHDPMTVVEIPKPERENNNCTRFRVGLKGSDIPEWNIRYSENDYP